MKVYEYHIVYSKPSKYELNEKNILGWELCDTPEGVIGRDLEKEPRFTHSKFYFRKSLDLITKQS